LRKGDFDAAQELITECRKSGALPLDICAEDESRKVVGLQKHRMLNHRGTIYLNFRSMVFPALATCARLAGKSFVSTLHSGRLQKPDAGSSVEI
jgi:hypothetical protein